MDFSYDENQQMLRDSVARFVAQEYGFDTRRAIVAGEREGYWQTFAELGWLMVPFSAELGGLGGSATDLLAIMEELGKGLVVEPFLSSAVLAGGIVAAADSGPRRAEVIEQLMSGRLELAFAYAEPDSRYHLVDVQLQAPRDGGDYVLDGRKAVVLNAPRAGRLIVSARTGGNRYDPDGISLFYVDPAADGVRMQAYRTVDGEQAAEIAFDGVRVPAADRLGAEGGALPAIEMVIERATVALCAEAVGVMEAIFRKTLEYTKVRKQFGVPIASFQALQHRMADMFIELEQAKSIAIMAALQFDRNGGDAAAAVSAAKSRIGRAARRVGEESVQLHGGIGITDELDVGHYFKRLTTVQHLFGSTDFHTTRYRQHAGRAEPGSQAA
jgi:alkylation response protein AidB-like acyl-CoA dehydrogenase